MSKQKIIPGTPNLQNTAYFDLNRNFSIKSEDTSTWEYPINNGMRLPAGTGVEIINTHLNYPGIVGSAIEILDDIEETLSYGFYNVHGSFFTLTPAKYGNDETPDKPADAMTKGLVLHDCLAHRNTENQIRAPLLKVDTPTTVNNDPNIRIEAVKAGIIDFDLTNNVDNPQTALLFTNFYSDAIYDEYYTSFTDSNGGDAYTHSFTDRVISVNVADPGVNYVVGDKVVFTGGTTSTKTAFGWVTKVDGLGGVTAVKLAQIGEGYTSAPAVSVVSTAPTAAGVILSFVMGGAFSTTTSGSGTGQMVGQVGNLGGSTMACILKNGRNYRCGDKCFINDGSSPDLGFFPLEYPTCMNTTEAAVATFKVDYTTALDIPSPGYFTVASSDDTTYFENETIYYRNASATTNRGTQVTGAQDILFTANENPALPNERYIMDDGATTNDMFNFPNTGEFSAAQNCRYQVQLRQYVFPPSQIQESGAQYGTTPGADYKWIPQVTYRPSQYDEPFLNTTQTEPMFIPVMAPDHTVNAIVYLPGCRNDISCMNVHTDYMSRSKGNGARATFGCPPGSLGIIGGSPTSQALADFFPSFQVNFDKGLERGENTGQTYGFPETLERYAMNLGGGVKLGLNVGILETGNYTINPGTYALAPIIGDGGSGVGVGCQVDATLGFGFTNGALFCLTVSTAGTGYRVGERYTLVGVDGSVIVILNIQNDGMISNATNANMRNAQTIRTNVITGGIMDPLSNSMTKPALLKGKTNRLPGDSTNFIGRDQSTLPRFNFNQMGGTGFDSIEGCGGSNDPVGCVEFTADGYLKPFIQQTTIKIPRGVYGVNQLGTLISDQLTATTSDDYISSEISKLIPINNYEISSFTGVQNYDAGRKIFVPMSVFNTLMQLYRDGTTIPAIYKWDNYRFSHYYSFPKNFFPNGKSVTQQYASVRVQSSGGERAKWVNCDNSIIPPYEGGKYDQTRNGVLVGSTDFQLIYNSSKSIYELQFLHSAIRNPVYDKFGNQYPQAGQAGAFLKKLSNQVNVRGTTKQFRDFFGGEDWPTPQKLIERFQKPITRDTGVMIYNFSFKNGVDNATARSYSAPEYARYEDFFSEGAQAKNAWSKTLWSRLGFKYEQLNTDENRPLCQYLFTDPSKAVNLYGVTTDQALDNSVTTTISSLTNTVMSINNQNKTHPIAPPPPKLGSNRLGTDPAPANPTPTANQQVYNMTTTNNPSMPVFSTGTFNVGNPYGHGPPQDYQADAPFVNAYNPAQTLPVIYSSGLYNSALTNFVQSDGSPLAADNLPLLIQEGYFLITSDIIDSYKDSVKKNENIPVLAIVPKSNLASQDFVTTAFTNISHTISQEKVINKILVKVLNPDLTAPILREDSSIMMKITIPEEQNVEI